MIPSERKRPLALLRPSPDNVFAENGIGVRCLRAGRLRVAVLGAWLDLSNMKSPIWKIRTILGDELKIHEFSMY